ncbi:extracellular solute-binding protein family 1 [Xylanimonas cellulosilytica DSM 15894]|uniref:Extracellular solute-binding protein family 1 n=1 Tax=Xylanimonas cellulosilytica (strain DSM 15894 / JCM 12276 / CECT 5975 / KCTC 9989 / LMG 20990 / NBRC 107835 / XIL07) TaxID=446471 RepID=D1BTG2_XYLCX|nr:sugar ABC transporter substrate-binding protein [Xylanimonas cellulosilytica]ACZ29104.1 extracellular solute-binding protein family 1 [Xylanimonas cellulosilytica DSM 15894]
MKSTHRAAAFGLAGALALSLTACSSGSSANDGGDAGSTDGTGDGSGEVAQTTLRVVSLLPGSEQAAIDAFNAQVAEFEAANPGIDVVPEEYEWKATTFAAQLAGGTLPDVFEIPFTDAQTLIANGQLSDLDAQFRTLPYADRFNPAIVAVGTGADGHVYAVPAKNVYGVGLHYNRALFESAGLDPDDPPTTWDEVAEYAKKIADANPGVAGYMQMSQNNTGGWQLTVQTYSRGGRVQALSDDGATATSTINNPATVEALEWLQAMRWEDNSLGSNFLLDWGTINEAFAAGQVAMFTSGSDVYTSMIQSNGLDPAVYGLAALPLGDSPDVGVLSGGTLAAVPAGVDDAVKDAAIAWIDFFYTAKLVDEARAVADAETLVKDNQPVGTPVLPMFGRDQWEQNQEWIKDYVNVPLDQMQSYIDSMFDLPLVNEPARRTQDVYALLDPIVQAVLTDQNADIDQLLTDADTQAQALLDQE